MRLHSFLFCKCLEPLLRRRWKLKEPQQRVRDASNNPAPSSKEGGVHLADRGEARKDKLLFRQSKLRARRALRGLHCRVASAFAVNSCSGEIDHRGCCSVGIHDGTV